MKKWFVFLFFMSVAALSFAQPGSSSSPYNRYQSSGGQQSSMSPCEMLKNSDPEAYAFSQQLSPIHQSVFCQQFTKAQQKQAMSIAGSMNQGMKGSQHSITPDMAVEVVIQASRYSQNMMQQRQQPSQSMPPSPPPQPYPYHNQGKKDSSKRYSNH